MSGGMWEQASQIPKPLGSTSIKHRSDTFGWDGCLTNVDLVVFAIWAAAKKANVHWYTKVARIGFAREHCSVSPRIGPPLCDICPVTMPSSESEWVSDWTSGGMGK